MKNNTSTIAWLFTPFKFVAGTKALVWGLLILVVISVLGYFSKTYFDGALDIHYGCLTDQTSYLIHAFYQLSSWLLLTLVFYITARIVSKSAIRLIDFAGTIALSQAPLILAALLGFVPSAHLCLGNLDQTNLEALMEMLKDNIVMLSITSLVAILLSIWSIVLKYNAYSVSANVKGAVGGVSFTMALIVSEIISKVILYFVVPLLLDIKL